MYSNANIKMCFSSWIKMHELSPNHYLFTEMQQQACRAGGPPVPGFAHQLRVVVMGPALGTPATGA